ncbi:MAG: hypothetical protein ABFS38_14460 [Bacteroidota bacterium]
MRSLKIAFIFSFVLIFILGCSKEEIQPDFQSAADDIVLKGAKVKKGMDHFVPFEGAFEVHVETVIQMPIPGVQPKIQLVTGKGNASHMGKTAVSILQVWKGPNPDLPAGAIKGGNGDGTFTFVAANGDILTAEYKNGRTVYWSATEVDLSFNCTILSDGSTGRFADAEGSFTWTGQYNPDINVGNADIVGEIKY